MGKVPAVPSTDWESVHNKACSLFRELPQEFMLVSTSTFVPTNEITIKIGFVEKIIKISGNYPDKD